MSVMKEACAPGSAVPAKCHVRSDDLFIFRPIVNSTLLVLVIILI